MSDWSVQRVEQLAPDAASLKAAQGLTKPATWQGLGRNERLIWGECQGSGANPYQVRVDLHDVAYKCSCPSRKLPCKHTLGLLLMMASGTALSSAAAPGFVEEWSANRSKRAEAKQAKESSPSAPPDPEAKAKRVEKREQRIAAGMDQLEAWLGDVVGQGLAHARTQPASFWSQIAARLVDAQAPGIARRVRELADLAVSSPQWQSALLRAMARLQLLIDAYRNLDALPADLAAEVRTLVGWTQEQEALRDRAATRDHWLVVGRRQTQEDQLRVQHTWLHGERSDRIALILEFAVGNQPLAANHVVGQVLDADLVFFDGRPQLRALEKERHGVLMSRQSLPSERNVAQVQADYARQLAMNPWLERWPVLLGPVQPLVVDDRLWLEDAEHRRVPAPPGFRHHWSLVALAARAPITAFGEWDGETFTPLTVEHAGQLFAIASLGELPVLSRVA
jgi:hypothetical protein